MYVVVDESDPIGVHLSAGCPVEIYAVFQVDGTGHSGTVVGDSLALTRDRPCSDQPCGGLNDGRSARQRRQNRNRVALWRRCSGKWSRSGGSRGSRFISGRRWRTYDSGRLLYRCCTAGQRHKDHNSDNYEASHLGYRTFTNRPSAVRRRASMSSRLVTERGTVWVNSSMRRSVVSGVFRWRAR
jgi:hypothetical protein